MDVACSMLQTTETLKQVFWMVKRHSDVSIAVGACADMDRPPTLMEWLLILISSPHTKFLPKKGPSCHTFQTLLRLYRGNLMPHLLSWLTISLSTKFSGRQHSKFCHTPSICHHTKPILTASHPRHFATHKSYPNNLEGKNLN
jgi:hypothetical protein